MPKTNIRGGNKRKNGTDTINRTLDFADEGQIYGHVSKVLGGGNFSVNCYEKILEMNLSLVKSYVM